MSFTLSATCGSARAGILETTHGPIPTPTFMPVGTVGTVKGISPRELTEHVDAPIILGNTYHLFLRPGTELLREAGGLHKFISWDKALLTDSGGYQVYSLASRRSISEEGVTFQSHLDGSSHKFTPESVIDSQRAIGSDIMMVLDECPPGDATFEYAKKSNELTIRWAGRCLDRFNATDAAYGFDQQLFGITQGAVYPELRRDSAERLAAMDFPGYAIGGLSVGEPAEQMYEMVEVSTEILPTNKPRYLMGVGTPANLLENIHRGIDMFDCVMPTRNGRNGTIFTTEGTVNIRNKKWRSDYSPIDPGIDAYACQNFSRAYLRHLIMSNELLGMRLASLQNLTFYSWLMWQARKNIESDTFDAWKNAILPTISQRL